MFFRFYRAEGKLIPEIKSVAEFMAGQLGDCSGDKDETFMTLRVSSCHNRSKFKYLPTQISRIFKCLDSRLLETWLRLWYLLVLHSEPL